MEAVGPYMNDRGDWWVPTDLSEEDARTIVEMCIDYRDSYAEFHCVEVTDAHEHESDIWVDEVCIPAGCHKGIECWHYREVERWEGLDE